MSDYLPRKAPPKDAAANYLQKEREFNKGMQNLKSSPVEMVDDFQKPFSKDVPAEKITNPILPIKSQAEFEADKIIRESRKAAVEEAGNKLNYNELRKEFAQKAKLAAKGGKRLLGAVPILGGLASAAMSGDASAAVPLLGEADNLGPEKGSLDYRIETGTLTEEDKQNLRMQALQQVR